MIVDKPVVFSTIVQSVRAAAMRVALRIDAFVRAAGGVGIRVLKTPVRAPRANAICERFLGSVQRECLDQLLVIGQRHSLAVLAEYGRYFNEAGLRQGLHQVSPTRMRSTASRTGAIVALSVLNGLHHDYQRAG